MYLGIDLGTSSVKVVLMDEAHQLHAQSMVSLSVEMPKPLWSEQSPKAWWTATCDAIHILRQTHVDALKAVRAIGLSGQQHGATLLDANNCVLRPAILWNDGRSMAECALLLKRVPAAEQITGNRMMPGFTAPKLLWVAEHEPDIFARIAKVLLPKDYLRLQMTGDYASDMSDSAGTLWMDVAKREWSDEMLSACNLNRSHMPQLYEGSDVTGTLLPEIAQQWGMSSQVIVVGGAGDNAAGAMSVNVFTPGSAYLSLGTSGVYFVSSNQYQANPSGGVHTFCHCLSNLWHHMNCHLSATACIDWFCHLFPESNLITLFAEIERAPLTKEDLIFLPYLSGERSPHNNPYARGVFFGLTSVTTRADMMRAILEGVAFNFAEGQAALIQAGIHIGEVSVVGGGAKSRYWGKVLATALRRPLYYRKNREVGAAIGAAQLAWLAIHGGNPADIFPISEVEYVISPDDTLAEDYQRRRARFASLYSALFS